MHLACLLVIVYPPTWRAVLMAVGGHLLRMWAITVGFHRYFSHRSFRTSRFFQFVLAVLGTTAMQNDPPRVLYADGASHASTSVRVGAFMASASASEGVHHTKASASSFSWTAEPSSVTQW